MRLNIYFISVQISSVQRFDLMTLHTKSIKKKVCIKRPWSRQTKETLLK